MANKNYNEKIDQYLDGELESEEMASFEQSMNNDPSLEEEVRQNLLLREVAQEGYKENMRANIRKWKAENKQSGSKFNMKKLRIQLAAAASILIIIVATLFGVVAPQFSNEGIASRYYEPETDLGLIRGNNDADILRQAFENYEQANYSGAIPGFQRYPDNDKALYGLGLSYFQIEDFDSAINTFQDLVARDNIEYSEKAEFYLLLSYLKANQINSDFQQLLDKMIQDEGYYVGQAEGIKKNLDSFWRKLQ